MITGTLHELRALLGAKPPAAFDAASGFTGLSIDTRTLQPRNLFVAIKGAVDDGHKYLRQAFASGAAAAVVEDECLASIPKDLVGRCLPVSDSKLALREIARWWRDRFSLLTVAVTGTNGKTTTKEMIADVLAKKFKVYRSPGNLNNLFGIPLALAQLDSTYEACVLELGMSYPGEIAVLTDLVRPDIGLITNIGPAHLETMGSIENIARAKFELLEHLGAAATRVLNLDDEILARRFTAESAPKLSFALCAPADVRPTSFSANGLGRFRFEWEGSEIKLQLFGLHNLYNAVAACAVGRACGIAVAATKPALENFRSAKSRMQVLDLHGVTVIDDCYNANPTSMAYALRVLHEFKCAGRKFAVLGDMKELGPEEVGLHQQVGQLVAELRPDVLITVGKLALHIASAANVAGFDERRTWTFMSTAEAAEYLLAEVQSGDCVLVKASRAMKFDDIVERLTAGREERD